jgi:lipid-A-disaccharide synthase
VDSSAINLHFARAAKEAGIPVLYYVAPQLWASREGRMKKVRNYVDRLACIFPFEEMYFRKHGVEATYVGHPLFDEIPTDRQRVNPPWFPDAPPVLGIVPGSRRSEVKANLPGLIEVMHHIRSQFKNVTFLVPTTTVVDALVREMLAPHALQQVIEDRGFDTMMPSCDLVITKSGTSTLHVAAWNVPMVVVYHVNPLLWHLAGKWLVKTKKIAMVNILAGQTELVPEFIPFTEPDAVAACAIDLLKHPEKLGVQRQALQKLIATMDKPGASMSVAKIAMGMMG